MSEERRDEVIEGHEPDGIREYDNPLPRWWLYLFYGTIVFSIGYAIYYHLGGPGKSVAAEYALEMEALEALKAAKRPKVELDEATLAAAYREPAQVAAGKALYASRCVACHGPDGQGTVGPNLTDEYWIHGGGTLAGIFKVVRDGVPAKGMIAWGTQLDADQLKQVVAFVASLSGTKPPNAKAPQGEKVAKVSWK